MTHIYLDYNATAPLRPQALAAMQEILAMPANPSSVHWFGREAKKHLERARKTIADAISVWPDEIIFTGSGTEANATALRGAKKVLVSAVEHSSVLRHTGEGRYPGQSARESTNMDPGLRRDDVIPVNTDGIIDLAALDAMITEGALVSVMLANNETGVIQPIAEVASLCKKHNALLHCDVVQALGKIPVDVGSLGADMVTIAGHKCGGPVGAAALVVRRGVPFSPLLKGGGQESNRRAGTENVAAIAGFAKAIELTDFAQMKELRGWLDGIEQRITSPYRGEVGEHSEPGGGKSLGKVTPSLTLPPSGGGEIFGARAPRLPNTSCIAMPGVGNEVQLMDFDLKGFAVSAGSACSSGRIEPSHVLLAMGVPKEVAASAIRISGGWNTTEAEIKAFTEVWMQTYQRLKKAA